MIKQKDFINKLSMVIDDLNLKRADSEAVSYSILSFIEKYMELKPRPLTPEEVEEHPLVKQVHESKKEEVRNYVRNLDYEWKREWLPEK
jgi:hypothetical protein